MHWAACVRADAQGARDSSMYISAMYLGYLSRLFISAQVFVPPVVGIALGAVAAIYAKQLLLPPQAIREMPEIYARDIPEIYARALAAATG